MQKLIIVESPAKCKKIEEYLGSGYKCMASFGHSLKKLLHSFNEAISESRNGFIHSLNGWLRSLMHSLIHEVMNESRNESYLLINY